MCYIENHGDKSTREVEQSLAVVIKIDVFLAVGASIRASSSPSIPGYINITRPPVTTTSMHFFLFLAASAVSVASAAPTPRSHSENHHGRHPCDLTAAHLPVINTTTTRANASLGLPSPHGKLLHVAVARGIQVCPPLRSSWTSFLPNREARTTPALLRPTARTTTPPPLSQPPSARPPPCSMPPAWPPISPQRWRRSLRSRWTSPGHWHRTLPRPPR